MPKIEAFAGFECIVVHIDGIPHLWIDTARLLGMRSYVDGNNTMYGIVFAMDGGELEVEYDKRDNWVAVLNAIGPLLLGSVI